MHSKAILSSSRSNEDTQADRIEPIPKSDFPHDMYPRWIGHKFSPSGETLPYPGNTIIAHLPHGTPFHLELQNLLASLKKHDMAPAFAFLPPSSWHVTLYEGVTDQIRLRRSYPGDMSMDSSLKACHVHVASRLADFAHELGTTGVGEMKVVGLEPVVDGLGLTLQTTDIGQETRLRSLRDCLSTRLKMRHPGHATYSWHMALAYTLRHLSEGEKGTIEAILRAWIKKSGACQSFVLGTPEFCVYDNMCEFRRVFYLE